jgi:hypothetical protein
MKTVFHCLLGGLEPQIKAMQVELDQIGMQTLDLL